MKRNASTKKCLHGETKETSEAQKLQEINEIKEKLRGIGIKKELLKRGELPSKMEKRTGGPISRHSRIIGQETGNYEEDRYVNSGIRSTDDDDDSDSEDDESGHHDAITMLREARSMMSSLETRSRRWRRKRVQRCLR